VNQLSISVAIFVQIFDLPTKTSVPKDQGHRSAKQKG